MDENNVDVEVEQGEDFKNEFPLYMIDKGTKVQVGSVTIESLVLSPNRGIVINTSGILINESQSLGTVTIRTSGEMYSDYQDLAKLIELATD